MGDVERGCFFTFYMEELVGKTIFKYLEYGTSLSNVENLEGVQYPYFWRYWETFRSFEVFASWDFVWVVSYLGLYKLYFHFWFSRIC